ncbi:unnamed protein product [Hapterophycus canaliculatus]
MLWGLTVATVAPSAVGEGGRRAAFVASDLFPLFVCWSVQTFLVHRPFHDPLSLSISLSPFTELLMKDEPASKQACEGGLVCRGLEFVVFVLRLSLKTSRSCACGERERREDEVDPFVSDWWQGGDGGDEVLSC